MNPLSLSSADHKENIKEGEVATPGGEALGDGAEQDAAAAPPGGAADTDNIASPESKGAEGGTAPEVSSTAGPTDKYVVCQTCHFS